MTRTDPASAWCILRCAGARTLKVAASLQAAGFEVWTPVAMQPRRPFRGVVPAGERAVPILPTFAFARASRLVDLLAAASDPTRTDLPFSVFHQGERVPLIGERQMAALRQAEADAAEEARRRTEIARVAADRAERAAMLRTEAARRKALRAERRAFEVGSAVTVTGMPAVAGLTGTIVESRGNAARIHFGGLFTATVEAWQVLPVSVSAQVLDAA